MKVHDRIPVSVLYRAHAAWPKVIGRYGLYGVAFFGHGTNEENYGTSVYILECLWRGLVRSILQGEK